MRLQHEKGLHIAPAGLYIHIPFCVRKCPYCDFYSVTDLDETEAFVDAIVQEMSLVTRPEVAFDTIYVGGGTPSLLKPVQLERILGNVFEQFPVGSDVEVSIEVNPGTVTFDSLRAFLHCGVNRVNIGIQSFDDDRLRFLGRVHSTQDGRQAIRFARDAGVKNLGLDLIYGLPDQSVQDWRKDLREAAGHDPEHLSCYMLSYEEGTPLDDRRRAGSFTPLEEAAAAELFGETVNLLGELGYEQYEISNFARKRALRSRHNQKYWCHAPYIGLGPSAHSFVEPKRWWNQRSLWRYVQLLQRGELPLLGSECLDQEQLLLESILLGLRTSAGINLALFKRRHGVDFLSEFRQLLARLEAEEFVSVGSDQCRLTLQGMILADTIIKMFVDQIKE